VLIHSHPAEGPVKGLARAGTERGSSDDERRVLTGVRVGPGPARSASVTAGVAHNGASAPRVGAKAQLREDGAAGRAVMNGGRDSTSLMSSAAK